MKKKRWFLAKFVPNSLQFQLLSRSLLILSVLLLLVGVLQYLLMKPFVFRNEAVKIQSQIMSLPPTAWLQRGSFMERDDNSEGQNQPRFFIPNLSLALIDESGNFTPMTSFSDTITTPELSVQEYQEIMKTRTKTDYRLMADSSGNEQLVVFQMVGNRERDRERFVGLIQASTSTKPMMDILIQQLVTFLSLSMLALLVGLLTFLPILKRTLVPLSNMVSTVKRIDSGNLAERLPVHQGQLEIDRLSTSFNGMLERLEISFEAEKEAKEQMRRFVADASHELRTPLTSIHGFLEVLLRGAANQPEQLDKALRSMHGESERINKLVNDLLLLAKLDRTPTFHMQEGRLGELILDMEPQLRMLAGDRSVQLHLNTDMRSRFDTDKMKQVILNLFHNAVQHTHPQTGRIQLILKFAQDHIIIGVADNGPGIPEEHVAYVFDRFYRIDTSRVRKIGGAGLGLSITKSIVELHGGVIDVDSKPGEGSTFLVRLPVVMG